MRDYVAPVKTIRFRNDKEMRDKLYTSLRLTAILASRSGQGV